MARVMPEIQTSVYIVKENDTLTSVSIHKTGSSDYRALYALNRDLIGSNPNNLKVGMKLTIPGTKHETESD